MAKTTHVPGKLDKQVAKLIHHHDEFGSTAILAGVVAGVTALISVAALMRWFKVKEVKGFDPFAFYCWIAGAGSLAWLLIP